VVCLPAFRRRQALDVATSLLSHLMVAPPGSEIYRHTARD
jgi:hypothetical protein